MKKMNASLIKVLAFALVLLIGAVIINPLAVRAYENIFGEELSERVILDDTNLIGIFDKIYLNLNLEAKGDAYVVQGCEETVWLIPLIDRTNDKRLAFLYYIPENLDYFVLDLIPDYQDYTNVEMMLHIKDSGIALFLSKDRIGLISQEGIVSPMTPGQVDYLGCIGKTLGITANLDNLKAIFSSASCTAMSTLTVIQTGLHCISMFGIGANLLSSTFGCITGIAKLISCGILNCSIPPAPTNVNASDGTYSDKVYITWKKVSVAQSYNIYRATSSSGSKTKIGSSNSTSYSDTSATKGQIYYYWVTAVTSVAESNYSSYDTGRRK